MMVDAFLWLVSLGILCGVFAVGGALVEGWMRYEDHKKLRGKERI